MEKTACKNCKNLIRKDGGKIWYDLFCGATKNKTVFDPLTGSFVLPCGEEHSHICDVNFGDCDKFIKKPSLISKIFKIR